MENNANAKQTIDTLVLLFQSYDDKIKRYYAMTDSSIRRTLAINIRTQVRLMRLRSQLSLIINLACVLIIALVYKPFLHGWSTFLPYIALLLSSIANTIASIFESRRFKWISHVENEVITNMLQYEKYLLMKRQHHLWSMYIGIPITLFAVPQFCAILKGWDFYSTGIWDEPYYLIVLCVAVLAGLVAEIWYYRKTKNDILTLKENITQYHTLQNIK